MTIKEKVLSLLQNESLSLNEMACIEEERNES